MGWYHSCLGWCHNCLGSCQTSCGDLSAVWDGVTAVTQRLRSVGSWLDIMCNRVTCLDLSLQARVVDEPYMVAHPSWTGATKLLYINSKGADFCF